MTGDLDIKNSMTINGAGATKTIIDANKLDGAFDMYISQNTVAITGVTIEHGAAVIGGAIRQIGGTLTIANSIITDNTATDLAGGLSVYAGTMKISNTVIKNNTSGKDAGGLSVSYVSPSTAILTDSDL